MHIVQFIAKFGLWVLATLIAQLPPNADQSAWDCLRCCDGVVLRCMRHEDRAHFTPQLRNATLWQWAAAAASFVAGGV